MSYQPGIGGLRRSRNVERIRALVPDTMVSGGRTLGRQYGVATASWRSAPDFLIIGAKKGGTTSLANWLAGHPQVMGMIPRWQSAKSCHYFDVNYWRGREWYLSHFPSRAARKVRSRVTHAATATGETSPYYLFHPAAAARIAETAPDVRLIAILREPVSRAYSHYWDRRATGHETLETFEEAIAAEPTRLAQVSDASLQDPHAYSYEHDHHTYLARGEYATQLRCYLDRFPRESLLILLQDDLRKRSEQTFADIETFLGLRRTEPTLTPRNVRSGYPPIDPRTRDRLRAHFEPHNAELSSLLGRPLAW